jgi:hypothetical protein
MRNLAYDISHGWDLKLTVNIFGATTTWHFLIKGFVENNNCYSQMLIFFLVYWYSWQVSQSIDNLVSCLWIRVGPNLVGHWKVQLKSLSKANTLAYFVVRIERKKKGFMIFSHFLQICVKINHVFNWYFSVCQGQNSTQCLKTQ